MRGCCHLRFYGQKQIKPQDVLDHTIEIYICIVILFQLIFTFLYKCYHIYTTLVLNCALK